MALDSTVVELIGAVLSGSAVTELVGWLRRRNQERKIARDAVEAAARDLVTDALSAADGQMARMQAEIDRLRAQMTEMEHRHDGEMDAMRTRHAECEKRTAELEDEIRRLMAGRAAEYKPSDLRRVGGKP